MFIPVNGITKENFRVVNTRAIGKLPRATIGLPELLQCAVYVWDFLAIWQHPTSYRLLSNLP